MSEDERDLQDPGIPMKHARWDSLPNVDYPPTPNQKYPWHKWFNGTTWLLMKGEQFKIPTDNMVQYIREMASSKGHSIKIKVDRSGNIYLKRVGSLRGKRLRHAPDPIIEAVLKGKPMDEIVAMRDEREKKDGE